jgi:cytochrome b pre-mRNA-processing protein 3
MLNVLRRAGRRKNLVRSLYAAIVARSREPVFFAALGVPDTIDGRFDLIALHAWMVMDHLKTVQPDELSQGLADTIFVGFEEGLRDLGAGDMSLGRRMKDLANAFYGRVAAYNTATDEGMAQALIGNLYRGAPGREHEAAILARYVSGAREALARCDAGVAEFGSLPEPPA